MGRWWSAEGLLLVGWAAMAVGLLSYGWRHGNFGVMALALFAMWQLCHVWESIHRATR